MVYNNFDDVEGIKAKVDKKAASLFRKIDGEASLHVSRSLRQQSSNGELVGPCVQNQTIQSLAEIAALREQQNDVSQIFVIRQKSSLSTLNTSREMIEGLVVSYNIFAPFWKCVLTFGNKIVENEFEFPGFRSRQTLSHGEKNSKTHESTYVLRRVEYNGRKPASDRTAWSIRQTAVYHQMTTLGYKESKEAPINNQNKSMFVLISPSKNIEKHLSVYNEQPHCNPWEVQRLLVIDSLRGWSDYMTCLEAQLRKHSQNIICADPGSKEENLAPLTEIIITFADRQELKKLQDAIQDLRIVLPTLLNILKRMQMRFKVSYQETNMAFADKESLRATMEEFEEFIEEGSLHVQRSKALEDRVKATTKLMSDLLSYEEAVALKELAKESHNEGQSMHKLTVSSHHLTARSTKDAAAVKILTIITLIYLPTTIVANFFSTQFVQKGDNGQMQVATNVWLLAVISIPLTIITILVWWAWVSFTQVQPLPADETTVSVESHSYPRILRRGTLRSLLSSPRRKRTQSDEESGQMMGSLSPPSPASTFKSDATTLVKEG